MRHSRGILSSITPLSIPLVSIAVFAVALAAASCDRGDASVDGGSTDALARAAQLPVPVAVQPAERGTIASYYKTTATLEVEKQADVLARVNGVLKRILVEEGDSVEEDTPLLLIENDEYRLRLQRAETNRETLTSKHDRLQEMLAEDLVSQEEYDLAKNELALAKADEELARLNLEYTTVVSPFTGQITRRHVDEGRTVEIGAQLFTVADFQPLLARVGVPAKEFRKIKADQTVQLVLDSSGERLDGLITLVSPTIDPATGTIKVTVEITEYPPGTRPGDFAQVQIVTEERPSTTLVEKSAVLADKGERVVYVAAGADAAAVAERRVVEVGFTDDLHAEILSGVTPGDRVVVKGQRSIKHGARLKILADDPLSTSSRSPSGTSS